MMDDSADLDLLARSRHPSIYPPHTHYPIVIYLSLSTKQGVG